LQEVVFKITDASLPNLTMVDLPGLPAPTDELYQEVKKLVHREVQNPHNIVLCIDWWAFSSSAPGFCVRFNLNQSLPARGHQFR